MKELIEKKDYQGIRNLLSKNPNLANEGIPYDEKNTTKAHPLHRICDGVFAGKYSDEEAVEIAKIFLELGANVNGFELVENHDTPLVAASSLHADQVAILYIENGAIIHHAGCHGGTALHWASWCGRDKLVERLIREKAEINKRCIDFKGTPLLWAVHGYKFSVEKNRHNQIECARILIQAGADKKITNIEGATALDFLDEDDVELIKLLS
jgi:uncharacterized protein